MAEEKETKSYMQYLLDQIEQLTQKNNKLEAKINSLTITNSSLLKQSSEWREKFLVLEAQTSRTIPHKCLDDFEQDNKL